MLILVGAKKTLKERAGDGDDEAASKTYLSEADFEVLSSDLEFFF